MPTAGKYRHRVLFQEKSATVSGLGEEVVTWPAVATLWGLVRPLNGRELLRSQAEQTEVTTAIELRYYAGLEPVTRPVIRAVWDGHTYDVKSVIPDPKKTEMTLLGVEIL